MLKKILFQEKTTMPILIALLIILTASNTAADVRFITETENTADYEKFQKLNPKYNPQPDDYTLNNEQRCRTEGYTYKRCSDGMLPADPCPYDGSLFANCCPDTYRYSAAECRAMGKEIGKYSCGGFYKCQ